MKQPTPAGLKRQTRDMILSLAAVFVLGAALTTVLDYDPKKITVAAGIILVSHFVVAVILLIGASMLLWSAHKLNTCLTHAWTGFSAILVSIIAGSIASQNGNDWAVYAMALGFIVAILAYGVFYARLTDSKH